MNNHDDDNNNDKKKKKKKVSDASSLRTPYRRTLLQVTTWARPNQTRDLAKR